jgi:hypothetical protein
MCVSRERFFEYIENISQEPNIDVSLLCGGRLLHMAHSPPTAEGKKYAGTVELDADEKGEFFLLEGKAEQEAFVNKVLKRRGELTLHSDPPDPAASGFLIVKFNRLEEVTKELIEGSKRRPKAL